MSFTLNEEEDGMKHVIQFLILVGMWAIPLGQAFGQITITEADVRDQMAAGKSLTNVGDTLTTSVDIGSPGATQWDFSGLLSHTTTTLVSVPPASTPYASQFPGSTFAFQTQVSLSGITATAYLYLVLSTNLYNPGSMGGTSSFLGPLELKRVNTPADVVYALPSTYGTTWMSVYSLQEDITLNGSPITSSTKAHSVSYVVDAYGPMTIPGGTVHDALRIRKEDSTSTGKSVGYIFLAKDGASVQVTASDVAAPDNGIISVYSVAWNGAIPTDVSPTNSLPNAFTLLQNYPNPFNPTTTIEFALPHQTHGTLKIFNALGEEVAVLMDKTLEAGRHTSVFDAGGLASGVYLYRLQADGFVQSRRMTLVR